MTTKYTIDGHAVEVVQALSEGFLVRSIYECDGEEPRESTPWVCESVFNSAPTLKFDARIEQLRATVLELEEKQRKLREDTTKADAGNKALLKKCEQYEALKLLEQYLDGKITHYVNINGYSVPEIIPIGETQSEYSRGELKLLCLFGSSKGSLNWKLNRYSDGSGSYSDVFPCTSLEAANEILKTWILNDSAETADRPTDRVIQAAAKFNLPLPEGYKQKHLEKRLNGIRENIDSLKKIVQHQEAIYNSLLPTT